MADIVVDYAVPAGTDAPSTIDDEMRKTRQGFIERLDVDHYIDAGDGTMILESVDGGKHRQVTYRAAISTPTVASGEAQTYSKTVSAKEEFFFKNDTDSEIQITSVGTVLVTAAGVIAVCDGQTLFNDSGTIKVQLDDATLEYDATAKVRIKTPAVPSSGSDAYPDAIPAPVMAYGSYNGSESNQDIDAGITIKHLVIRSDNTSTNGGGVELIVCDAGTRAWHQKDGSLDTDISVSDTVFTVTGNKPFLNDSGDTYYWAAYGTR